MNKTYFILVLTLFSQFLISQKLPNDYVDVFTGTSNSRWMLFPGPSMPFGMVKLSPDNQDNVWNGGYEYANSSISGFSHVHGMSLSGVSYMPFVGDLFFGEEYPKLFPGPTDGPFGNMWTAGYRSRYTKESENGSPGYYSVHLLDPNVTVELTTTKRCGMIRSTFPESPDSYLLLDFDPAVEVLTEILDVQFRKISDVLIEGAITSRNEYSDVITVYFRSKFNAPIKRIDGWQWEPYTGTAVNYGVQWRREYKLSEDIDAFTGGAKSGVILHFDTKEGQQVTTATGLSFVSLENAALNLETELGALNYDFDQTVVAAQKEWNNLLGAVEVKGKEADKEKFYTNFYRSFTGKNLMSDVNGEYTDMCENTQTITSPADAVYSSDALWGAQWNLFPLWTLVAPKYANSFANSFIELQKHGGWIPEAPVGLEYSPIMGAQHQNALLISAYQKGIAQFDAEKVFDMIKHDYTTQGIEHPCGGYAGNRHMGAYMQYGYVPEEVGPTSNTMEYAFDDWCLGQFALALGKKKDANFFMDRSGNYKNLYDKESGYLRRKLKDGSWFSDFDPFRMGTEGGWNGPGYMEGNAWIYTWYAPHDLSGLIGILGMAEFNSRLEEGFEKGYVDLTNQPNLQAPFLFNYSGKPWLTQKYTRMVADEFFSTSPYSAYLGEEDEGQMGALYCLFSMGIFEMKGGCSVTPYYDLSSPVFDEITIHLNQDYYKGDQFVIRSEKNSPQNTYIQSVLLNNKKINQPRILHKDIVAGGELIIRLGDVPNEKFGSK